MPYIIHMFRLINISIISFCQKSTAVDVASMRRNGFLLIKLKEHRGETVQDGNASFLKRLAKNKVCYFSELKHGVFDVLEQIC